MFVQGNEIKEIASYRARTYTIVDEEMQCARENEGKKNTLNSNKGSASALGWYPKKMRAVSRAKTHNLT